MTRPALIYAVALVSAFAVATASAQDRSEETLASADAPVDVPPEAHPWQLDVVAGVALGHTVDFGGQLLVDMKVRFIHGTGHGLMLRGFLSPLFDALKLSVAAVELGYLYRVRAWEEDRVGLAIDLASGPLVGFADGSAECDDGYGRCGRSVFGRLLGAFWSAELVFYVESFNVGLGATYRLSATESGGDPGPIHEVTGSLGIGFGFWGH